MDTETRVDRAAGAAPRAGKLRTGAHVPTVGGAKASIPSRFETVLNLDAREANGFGRRTFRFDEPVNDLPGPGAYAKSRTIVNRTQVTLSTSAKGSAAFASGTKAIGLLPSNAFTPGPAAYSPEKPRSQIIARSAPTAAFRNPVEKRMLRVTAVAKDVPGPGAYRPEDYGRAKAGGKLTTLGAREVGPLTGPRTAPGPGEFMPDSYVNMVASNATNNKHGGLRSTSPAHDGRAARRDAEAKAAIPPALVDTVGRALPPVVAEAALQRAQREKNTLVAGALKPLEPKAIHRSAAFADTTLDRFGNPTVRYTANDDGNLGPGSYDTEKKPRRMLISSAWALSAVDRGQPKPRYAVPGPAYYSNDAPPSKVSHHMLSPDYWS